jgi:hypothetical protein
MDIQDYDENFSQTVHIYTTNETLLFNQKFL